MRILVAAAALSLLALPAFAQGEGTESSPQDIWNGMVTSANFAYAGRDRAILKIDDAIYIDEGQTAYLVRLEDDRVHYEWTLEQPEDYVIEVTYTGEAAPMRHVLINEAEHDMADDVPETFPGQNVPENVTVIFETDLITFMDDEANDSYVFDDGIQLTGGRAQMRPGELGYRMAVYNQNHPDAEHFEGTNWYPYNADLIVEATFEPLDEFVPTTFQTSRGWYKEFYTVGHAVFDLDGETLRMPLYGYVDSAEETEAMSSFFTDAESGHETYGVGRYLDVEIEAGSFPPATVTLDFNYAYNPLCARSDHYNCPYAEFEIPVRVPAGEMNAPAH